ncbi:MAG: type II toxin-antitoxin system RelE/ParE family toxin [Candidatus Omnitrophica bacterium]|nr:type II toxin-antitoxin system RelE/ParE family toxin [Candidatus Omnitrophota bacterium]
MADFRIFETARFLKDLEQDFTGQRTRIRQKLTSGVYPQLRTNPYLGRHIKKLRDVTPETWRYRIGDYRFFYTVDGRQRIVFMLAIDHRGQAY